MSRKSTIKSDLKRIDAMRDEDIDYTDIPTLDEGFFKEARVVVSPGKLACYAFHRLGQRLHVRSRVEYEMDVVCHQAVAVDLDVELTRPFSKDAQIRLVVVLFKEYGLLVVPSLKDVMRRVRKYDACRPWHRASLHWQGFGK